MPLLSVTSGERIRPIICEAEYTADTVGRPGSELTGAHAEQNAHKAGMTKREKLAIVFFDILQTACIITQALTCKFRTKIKIRHLPDRMIVGTEWLIEATGCDRASLRDEVVIRSVINAIIADLGLISIGDVWHKFGGEGGVTGMVALTESHLACHTYPENEIATFNLYCCRSRPEWDWDGELRARLSATDIRVLRIDRGSPAAKNAGGTVV